MNPAPLPDEKTAYLDLSSHFPSGIFACLTLRGEMGWTPEELEAFLERRGLAPVRVHGMTQVHGSRVVEAAEAPCDADAVVVRRPGDFARVVTADCVPILLARKDGSACAAVHAGWKGTLSRIVERAALFLMEGGEYPLTAYLGPAIGPCCYGVSVDRYMRFRQEFGKLIPPHAESGPYRLDLRRINAGLLRSAGVSEGDIEIDDRCTSCSIGLFWSYRRDGERAGRMAALIGRRP
jgi:YfiH family protein